MSLAQATPTPEAGSLKRRALRGTLLSLVNVVGVQVLRLAGNLITTRLLFPEAYGLMLLVLVLHQGLQMLSDIGILPSIIQHPRGEERDFVDTAWTLQVVRGLGLAVVTALVAWPYARYYDEPQLFALVLFAALHAGIGGLTSTKLATLNRRMDLGRLVVVNLSQQLATLVVMVGWAILSPTVWALIGGAIAGEVVRVLLSHVAVPGPTNRLRWEREAVAAVFHFGKWILLSTLITYVGLRFDAFALGKLEALGVLGVYNVGQSLAGLPTLVTGQIVIWVLLPALSETYRRDAAGYRERVRRTRGVLNAAGVLMVTATAVAAPSFFYLLYDPRYHEAGWMVQLTMFPTWFFFLQETSVRVQLAMGDSRAQMLANAVKLAATVPGALGGYWLGDELAGNGVAGLILGLTLGAFVGYAMIAWSLRREGIRVFAADAKWTALGLALGLFGGASPWLLEAPTGIPAPILSLGFGAAVVVPYGLWAVRWVRRELRRDR